MALKPLELEESTYQRLSEIFARLDSDYEDPTLLLERVSQRQHEEVGQVAPRTGDPGEGRSSNLQSQDLEASSGSLAYNGAIERVTNGTAGGGDGSRYSDVSPLLYEESDSSEEEEARATGARIPQTWAGRASNGRSDDRLYVAGSLTNLRLGKGGHDGGSKEGGGGGELRRPQGKTELEKQGIFQGMVLNDFEKWRLGILPDHLYMTGQLERRGEELEDLSVEVCVQPVVVPETPFDPNSQVPLRKPPPEPRISPRSRPSSQGQLNSLH